MSEQTERSERDRAVLQGATGAMEAVSEVMQQLTSAADVSAAFGDPQTVGNRTLIPVAEVMCGVGLGMGLGQGESPSVDNRPPATGGGGGAGAGGGARARPIAVIVVEPEGVSVRPVVDVTALGLAGLTTAAVALLWIGRLFRADGKAAQGSDLPSERKLARLLRHRR